MHPRQIRTAVRCSFERPNSTAGIGGLAMQIAPARMTALFHLFLIKPSHYDDDGYVIQWARSSIPANTLATLNGLALDCAGRRVLGEDVEIRVTAWDETNTRIRPDRIVRQIRKSGGCGLVALVGV